MAHWMAFHLVISTIEQCGLTNSCTKLFIDFCGMRFSIAFQQVIKAILMPAANKCKKRMHEIGAIESFSEILTDDKFEEISKKLKPFVVAGKQASNAYAFWYSYLKMAEMLLHFIRATREGNWKLHLATLRVMLPWFFAYDRVNYSRYLPIYLSEMLNLEHTHPVIYAELVKGEFVVQRQSRYGFSQDNWADGKSRFKDLRRNYRIFAKSICSS